MPELQLSDVSAYVEAFAAGDRRINEISRRYSREELCLFLQQNIEELEREVCGMTPPQLAYRLPGSPGGWDTSGDERHFDTFEIVTHMASGITFHWWGIARALGQPRPIFPKPPEGVATTGKNRNGLGAGGWTGVPIEEALALLEETTAKFVAYVDTLPETTDEAATSSLGVFKRLTAHSWLFLDALHAAMHLEQLRQMQAQPDYPA